MTTSPTVASPSTAAFAQSCPAASEVDAALGQTDKAPVGLTSPYGLSCTYQGTGVVPTKIEFQQDTVASFSAGEQAVSALGVTKVSGLGDQAYVVSGFLDVLQGTEAMKIVSPLSTPAQLEALAHKILA